MFNFGYDLDDFGFSDMHRMIGAGTDAREFAWRNYDKLASRPTEYTLYGPPNSYIGVLAAGGLTPAKRRKVQLKNRRERYIAYELDNKFNLLRIKHMCRFDQVECTIHFFFDDGVIYGQPFSEDKKEFYPSPTVMTAVVNERPAYVALVESYSLCAEFYKYPEDNYVKTIRYLYRPASKYCSTGQKSSWEAPIGAQNSPVTLDYMDEEYSHIEFASFFR